MLPSQHFDSLLQPGAESGCNNTGCFNRAARRGADRQDSRQKAAVCCAGKAGTSKGGNPSKELIVRSYPRAPSDINAHCHYSNQKEFLSWWDDFPHDGVTSSPRAFCFIPVTLRFPVFCPMLTAALTNSKWQSHYPRVTGAETHKEFILVIGSTTDSHTFILPLNLSESSNMQQDCV